MTKFVSGEEYIDQTFDGIVLRDAVVEGVEFVGCSFEKVQFSGANFQRCKFIECKFRGCDLSTWGLKSTILRETTFEDSKVIGVVWGRAASLQRVVFKRCVLSFGNFIGLDLRRGEFEDCVLREVDLTQANLSEANLKGCDLSGAKFLHTNLTKADLRGAKGYAMRPAENTLNKTRFSLPEATALLYGLNIVLDS